MHDIAAHHVYTMIVQADLGLAGRRSESDALAAVRESAAEAMLELDRLLGVLTADQPGPDVAGIVRRAERLGIAIDADLGAGVEGLPAETRHVLARLEPEGLTNALKHAGPTAVRVSLERAADAVTVAVEDRGPAPGRDPRPPSGGYGLGGMRTRVEDLGGRLSFGRTGPGGWRLQAEIPLAGSAKTDLSTGS